MSLFFTRRRPVVSVLEQPPSEPEVDVELIRSSAITALQTAPRDDVPTGDVLTYYLDAIGAGR